MAEGSVPPLAREAPEGWFGWDLWERKLLDDPYPTLRRLRDEVPVHRTPMGFYRILRHRDVVRVLKELKVGVRTTDGRLPGVDESVMPRRFMLMQDPPNHTRLRRLVSRAFTPHAIKRLQPHVQALVDELIDSVLARGDGQLDVIADLALPLPSTVICEMLGVPLQDRPKFTEWTAQVTHLLSPLGLSEQAHELAAAAAVGLIGYMADLIEQRRARLTDDMLSVLIRAEEDGDQLSTEELITQSVGLLVAGFETTIGLIGNGVRQLLLHPAELAKLQRDPSLIGSAVEECLRFDGPIPMTRRVLHQDAVFDGIVVRKDVEVLLSLASAHRDPEVFQNPDEFRIERKQQSHLAFGGGIHFCLGAHLARMEAQIAIGTLVRRIPDLELASRELHWGQSLFRVLGRLPVTFGSE
jgi:cytochrome P450